MNQTILKLHQTAEFAIRCGVEMAECVEALGRQVASPEIKKALLELLNWPAAEVRVRCVEVLGRKYLDLETQYAFTGLLVNEKSQRVIDAVAASREQAAPPKP